MYLSEIDALRPGDAVQWTDPDDGLCSRIVVIGWIQRTGDMVRISDTDNISLEVLASELSSLIPADFPVQPLGPEQQAKDKMTCGHCGRSWDDAITTGMTPVPSGRCPFEAFHTYPSSATRAKPMTATQDQANQYVDNRGTCCLFCGDDDIVGDPIEINDGRASQTITCSACGQQWVDGYTLDSVLAAGTHLLYAKAELID